MKNDKFLISVLIEGDRIYTHEYTSHQKLQVIINQTVEHLQISTEGRELKREDGTPVTDLSKTIEETGLRTGETLRFFKKTIKPDRDKGFANE